MAGKTKKKAVSRGKGKAAPKPAKGKLAAKGKAKAGPRKAKATPAKKAKPAKPAARMKAAARKPAAKPAPRKPVAGKPVAPARGDLQVEILAIARQVYGNLPDKQLLALDPNDVDEMDPATFYEMIAEKFGIEGDDADPNFGGFGGPIAKLVAFVGARWDGKTRKDAPMPPKEWVDEFVHPATERVPHQAEPLDEPLLD